MNRFASFALLTLIFATPIWAAPVEIHFTTSDDLKIYGDLYPSSEGKSAAIILLFHQAGGDARGEYEQIAERLVANGYNVLAIDQRSGGDRFGGENRTMANMDGSDYGYCDVYPDLQATLEYTRKSGFSGPLAVWGSSYSAALVFQLGATNPEEVSAILGFSPASGPPLAECSLDQYLDDLTVPALALRPQREFENDSVKTQMKEFERFDVQTWIADPGVHGSSMLVADRVGASAEETWQVVLEFLAESLASENHKR